MLIFSISLLISNLISIILFIFSIYESVKLIKKKKKEKKEMYLPQFDEEMEIQVEVESETPNPFEEEKSIVKEKKKIILESPMWEIQLSPMVPIQNNE
jgi:tRNA/tmRNA/rRNA uracil-C5-methylase (TrmA/RlmC/RlmD family)